MDGPSGPKRAGLGGRKSSQSAHTSYYPETNSPPLKATPPTSKRLSLENFRKCLQWRGDRTERCRQPVQAKVSSGSRIGQNIIPECTGSFCSLRFSRVVRPPLCKNTVSSYKTQSKALIFHYALRGGEFSMRWCIPWVSPCELWISVWLLPYNLSKNGVGLGKFLVFTNFLNFIFEQTERKVGSFWMA